MEIDYTELMNYAKKFTGLSAEQETLLGSVGPDIKGDLQQVTDRFYETLTEIEKAQPYLEGRIDHLKKTHLGWLETVFSGTYDEEFTAWMYKVGDIHVQVKLPVEFVAGAITIIGNALIPVLEEKYGDDLSKLSSVSAAVNSILGFSLMVMQESYQASTLVSELAKFLKITGMSRTLFDNLAKAYVV